MVFDPLDKKWQVSPDFPPDKLGTWSHPIEDDGWVLTHNSLRAEMVQMIDALEAIHSRGTLEAWEIDCVRQFWNTHYIHIHSHHSNEDEIIAPKLRKRFLYPDKVEADHAVLVAKLDKLTGMVKTLGEKEGDFVTDLLNEMKDYQRMMIPHLKQEEDEILPLAHAYFSRKEFVVLGIKILAHSPKVEMGSFINCMGEVDFRNKFMKQEGIPGIAWPVHFKGRHTAFQKEFVTPIEGLKKGVKPEENKSCCTIA